MSGEYKLATWSKGLVTLRVGTCHGKSPPSYFHVCKSSASRNIMYLICHVSSQDLLFKCSCEFVGAVLSQIAGITYFICPMTLQEHMIKGSYDFMGRVGAVYCVSAPCQVCRPWVLWFWRYKVFNLLCDLTRSRDVWSVWLYGKEPLNVSNHPAYFGDNRHCSSGGVIVRVCHVILPDHVDKGSSTFMIKISSRWVTTLSILMTIGTVVEEI